MTEILFSFRGRIPRRTYWTWVLVPAVNGLMVVALLLPWLMVPALKADAPTDHPPELTP